MIDDHGYNPDKLLVREDPMRPGYYLLVCLVCPLDVCRVDVSSPNNPGYPTLGTVVWAAQDHWRRAKHPGWVERP